MKEEKSFSIGQEVYVASGNYPRAGYKIYKGKIIGLKNGLYDWYYRVKNKYGCVIDALPEDTYENIESFKADIDRHIRE